MLTGGVFEGISPVDSLYNPISSVFDILFLSMVNLQLLIPECLTYIEKDHF